MQPAIDCGFALPDIADSFRYPESGAHLPGVLGNVPLAIRTSGIFAFLTNLNFIAFMQATAVGYRRSKLNEGGRWQ